MDNAVLKKQVTWQLSQYNDALKALPNENIEQRRTLQKAIFDQKNILDLIEYNEAKGQQFNPEDAGLEIAADSSSFIKSARMFTNSKSSINTQSKNKSTEINDSQIEKTTDLAAKSSMSSKSVKGAKHNQHKANKNTYPGNSQEQMTNPNTAENGPHNQSRSKMDSSGNSHGQKNSILTNKDLPQRLQSPAVDGSTDFDLQVKVDDKITNDFLNSHPRILKTLLNSNRGNHLKTLQIDSSNSNTDNLNLNSFNNLNSNTNSGYSNGLSPQEILDQQHLEKIVYLISSFAGVVALIFVAFLIFTTSRFISGRNIMKQSYSEEQIVSSSTDSINGLKKISTNNQKNNSKLKLANNKADTGIKTIHGSTSHLTKAKCTSIPTSDNLESQMDKRPPFRRQISSEYAVKRTNPLLTLFCPVWCQNREDIEIYNGRASANTSEDTSCYTLDITKLSNNGSKKDKDGSSAQDEAAQARHQQIINIILDQAKRESGAQGRSISDGNMNGSSYGNQQPELQGEKAGINQNVLNLLQDATAENATSNNKATDQTAITRAGSLSDFIGKPTNNDDAIDCISINSSIPDPQLGHSESGSTADQNSLGDLDDVEIIVRHMSSMEKNKCLRPEFSMKNRLDEIDNDVESPIAELNEESIENSILSIQSDISMANDHSLDVTPIADDNTNQRAAEISAAQPMPIINRGANTQSTYNVNNGSIYMNNYQPNGLNKTPTLERKSSESPSDFSVECTNETIAQVYGLTLDMGREVVHTGHSEVEEIEFEDTSDPVTDPFDITCVSQDNISQDDIGSSGIESSPSHSTDVYLNKRKELQSYKARQMSLANGQGSNIKVNRNQHTRTSLADNIKPIKTIIKYSSQQLTSRASGKKQVYNFNHHGSIKQKPTSKFEIYQAKGFLSGKSSANLNNLVSFSGSQKKAERSAISQQSINYGSEKALPGTDAQTSQKSHSNFKLASGRISPDSTMSQNHTGSHSQNSVNSFHSIDVDSIGSIGKDCVLANSKVRKQDSIGYHSLASSSGIPACAISKCTMFGSVKKTSSGRPFSQKGHRQGAINMAQV